MAINQNTKANTVTNVYESVTNRIIEQLNHGVIPWKTPYLATVGFPRNLVTGKPYRGINAWLLAITGYASPYFVTFLQAKKLGGTVKKGEKGLQAIKFGTFETEDQSTGEEKTFGYLKSYTVFNISQCDGLQIPEIESRPVIEDTCKEAKGIAQGMPNPPQIKYGTALAFYRPSEDAVYMPNIQDMTSPESFWSTMLHELTHASGAEKRLNRKTLIENKGMHASRQIYAEEELVAEMGSAFLCAHAGIFETECENSAAYIQGWLKALKQPDAKNWIIRAASQAQKAVDYILNITKE